MSARRVLALALAATAFALVGAPAAPAAAAPPDPAPLLLRLPDLGPGYAVQGAGFSGANRSCAQIHFPTRHVPRVLNQLGRFANRGCTLTFERAWTAPGTNPGPEDVTSVAFAFDAVDGARAMLTHARAVAATMMGAPPRYLPLPRPAASIGDEAVRLRLRFTVRRRQHTIVFVVWRSGSVVGLVSTSSMRAGNADAEAAHRLATAQQARIATPTPLRAPVNDDRLVLLDDPGLAVPVMWLGERLPA